MTTTTPTANKLIADEAEIRAALTLLMEPGSVFEMRAINTPKGTVSGYYNNIDALTRDAKKWSGQGPAVYFLPNPVKPDLLARACNRAELFAKVTTGDNDILRRRWFLIDFDPTRLSGISSTEEEHGQALEMAFTCSEWLRAAGWPAGILADSGNGAHLLFRIDLPNDKDERSLLETCLKALAFQFDTQQVSVDKTTFNASRAWKLYGTLAAKGDDMPDRPHRLARLLNVTEGELALVSLKQLQALASSLPESPKRETSGQQHSAGAAFDIDEWISRSGLPVVSTGPWNGGQRWILNPCPWNPDHTDKAAFIAQFSSGALSAGCHHNGCSGHNWHSLRDLVEPGWRERAEDRSVVYPILGNGHKSEDTGKPPIVKEAENHPPVVSRQWPAPMDEAAYYGLAGDFVRLIAPQSEADPAALLSQFLVAFGNLIGRAPYWTVEGSKHHCNLFAVVVAESSKGRKGTSLDRVRAMTRAFDADWDAKCVKAGLSSGEGLIHQVRDPVVKQEPVRKDGKPTGEYQDVITDPGVEDKRLLVTETEFGKTLRVMAREGNILSSTIRQAWDDGALRVLNKTSPEEATGAHISVIGHVTRQELLENLDSTESANGFGNRFLWVCARRSKLLPRGGNEVDLNPLATRLYTATDFARKCGLVQPSESAWLVWDAVYSQLSASTPGLAGNVTSRAEPLVMRLAVVYALLDCSNVVEAVHLQAALAFWEYCFNSARYVFGDALGNPVADEILRALRNSPDGLTRTAIHDHFGRNQSASRIATALGLLKESGLADYGMVHPEPLANGSPAKGRPSELWRVSK